MTDYKILIEELRKASQRTSNSLNTRNTCKQAADAIETLLKGMTAYKTILHGDCSYCKHYSHITKENAPCWHCAEFAAKEFVTGDYWERKE